jgi:hypothetical protein
MSRAGVNWSDMDVESRRDELVGYGCDVTYGDQLVRCGCDEQSAGINWMDVDVMSRTGMNWSDVDVMSRTGINWSDVDVMSGGPE